LALDTHNSPIMQSFLKLAQHNFWLDFAVQGLRQNPWIVAKSVLIAVANAC